MKKIADISQFESLLNSKQTQVTNSLYRDWWDRGNHLNVLGDEMDYIRTLGMAIADGNDEEYTHRTVEEFDPRYFPVNLSGIKAQICDKALDYYEEKSVEQGKLLDVDEFVTKVYDELNEGFKTFSSYRQLSHYALNETPKDFKALCYGLNELLRVERSRIAKEVRTHARWGKQNQPEI